MKRTGKYPLKRTVRAAALLVALCIVAFATPSFAANLVVNGGFETQDLSGWTTTDPNDIFVRAYSWFPGAGCPLPSMPTGVDFGQAIAMGGPYDLESLSQNLPTTPGATYNLSFWLGNIVGDPSFPSEFVLKWGNTILADSTTTTSFDMTYFAYDVTASSSTTTLTFAFLNPSWCYYLDNVDVEQTESTVPLPPALWLLGPGLAGLAFMRRTVFGA
jgi:hypothetical protein